MISEFSDILGKLYDATFDTNKWKPFLADFTEFFQGNGTHLAASVWNDEIVLSVIHGLSDTVLEAYGDYAFGSEVDPRIDYCLRHPSKPFHWGILPNLDGFLASPLYTKVFEPVGCHDQLLVQIPIEQDLYQATHLAVGVWRHRDSGSFCQADCDLLGEFVPHLKRVFELQRLSVNSQFSKNPAAEILESFPIGLMFCDSSGNVQFANSAARSITEMADGLIIRHRQLWTEQSELTKRLREKIRLAVESFADKKHAPPHTLTIARSSGRSPLVVVISAVTGGAPDLQPIMFRQPVAAVYVSDPDRQPETSTELLQRLFGLTPAESGLLRFLTGGASLKTAADLAGIAENTARGYLKQIFAKTNTGGQADLIRLISNSPAWLRHQAAEPIPKVHKP